MSTVTMTFYRCPDCSARTSSAHSSCPDCGLALAPNDRTWIIDPGTPVDPSPSSTPLGSTFEGRYEIIAEIGRGGTGVVYKAFDTELDEVIALKTLIDGPDRNPELVSRFKHELKVARRLTHPNLARLHDLVNVNGKLYLSMEFIPGKSLRQVLNETTISPTRVLAFLRQIAPAIDLAHQHGIVHRDLKPGNVVIDTDDVAHILDFGIATSRWSGEFSTTAIVGTPKYMAPEQWLEGQNGVTVDARADLYAFGIMLYEMLCGAPPFGSHNRLILMDMHRNKAPKPPREIRSTISEAMQKVVLKLLEKKPEDRYQRAIHIVEELARTTSSGQHPGDSGSANAPSSPKKRGCACILIADDDATLRKVLATQMKEHNVIVKQAADGEQTLAAAYRDSPDLILLDVRMPVIDGLDVLRMLKNDPRTREIPIVIMSGLKEAGQEALAKELGAATYLDKPVSGAVLDLVIERYAG